MSATHVFSVEADGRLLPMGADLSEEQRAALDLDHNVVVTAGAGSGKTRTLSRRVLRILAEFAWNRVQNDDLSGRGPRNLLVSTFTERAAAELQERVRLELLAGVRELKAREQELASHPKLNPILVASFLTQLDRYRQELDQARIGTFHSFCAASLREFAAELGLDPGFTILQGPDHRSVLRQIAESTLVGLEEAGDPTHQPQPGRTEVEQRASDILLHAYPRAVQIELIESWLKRRAELQPFTELLKESNDEALLERWAQEYGELALKDLEQALKPGSEIHQQLRLIAAMRDSYQGPAEGSPAIFSAADDALLGCRQLGVGSITTRGQSLRQLFDPFLTGASGSTDRKLRKGHFSWLGSKKSYQDNALNTVKDSWQTLRATLVQLIGEAAEQLDTIPAKADEVGLPVLRALSHIASGAVSNYRRYKAERALLDFSDLELEMLNLLRNSATARRRLQRRFCHILIDEFQDTNASQWSIVKQLAGSPLPAKGLFLVGDPKQAIYRFRGGDVTLFDRAIGELCNPEQPALQFSANYRSRPVLISFFNRFFAWLMWPEQPDRPSWEAPFRPLSGRRTLGSAAAPGVVDLLWLGDEQETEERVGGTGQSAASQLTADRLGREAALLAERLRDQHLPAVQAHGGIKAAILVRRRAYLHIYARALQQAGVPHVIARGRGFYARQEVLDLANLLAALCHPEDSISLIGALRGPFLALEDAWLLWLSMLGGNGAQALCRGWQRVLGSGVKDRHAELWNQLPETGQIAIQLAADRFNRWKLLCRKLPLSRFLHELLDETAAAHLLQHSDPSGQSQANINKLLGLAERYDRLGAEGVADFALFLTEQEEAQADEGEASIDASADVVLMTIHQSKGLEFPIVALPDLSQRIRFSDPRSLACARLGHQHQDQELWEPGLRVPVEDGQRSQQSMVLRTLIRQRNRDEELAESRRLLYVAMTRARDRLLCVAGPPPASAKKARGRNDSTSWEEWLRSWLEQDHGDGIQIETNAPSTSLTKPRTYQDQAATRPSVHETLVQPVIAKQERILTPHGLTNFSKPRQPAESRSRSRAPNYGAQTASQQDRVRGEIGRIRGLVLHSCLEDGIHEMGPEARRRLARALAQAGFTDQHLLERVCGELNRHLEGFRKAAPRSLLNAAKDKIFREVPFRLAMPNKAGWLRGIIDLLYRDDSQGCWIVLDYKTDADAPDNLKERYHAQLLAYAWAACQIIPELAAGDGLIETQILSTGHQRLHPVSPARSPSEINAAFSALLMGQATSSEGIP